MMNLRYFYYIGMIFLLLLCACAKPKSDSWPQKLQATIIQRRMAVPEGERQDFDSGFSDGANMVNTALKAGVKPYRPLQSRSLPSPRQLGRLPEETEIEEPTIVPDVDPETGLLIFPLTMAKNNAFAKGQVEGFTWALEAIGSSLVHPTPVLSLPNEWFSWHKIQENHVISSGIQSVELRWTQGLLFWGVKKQGFPDVRRWRKWSGPGAPCWAGLSEDVLWVETKRAQVVAIDLQSGGILEVKPAPIHSVEKQSDWDKYQESVKLEYNSPEFQKGLNVLRGEAKLGLLSAQLSLAKRLTGMGDEADREAFGWYLKAAEGGDSEAMLSVGVWLFHGRSVPVDKPAAKQWLARATRAGNQEAAAVMAMLFHED